MRVIELKFGIVFLVSNYHIATKSKGQFPFSIIVFVFSFRVQEIPHLHIRVCRIGEQRFPWNGGAVCRTEDHVWHRLLLRDRHFGLFEDKKPNSVRSERNILRPIRVTHCLPSLQWTEAVAGTTTQVWVQRGKSWSDLLQWRWAWVHFEHQKRSSFHDPSQFHQAWVFITSPWTKTVQELGAQHSWNVWKPVWCASQHTGDQHSQGIANYKDLKPAQLHWKTPRVFKRTRSALS